MGSSFTISYQSLRQAFKAGKRTQPTKLFTERNPHKAESVYQYEPERAWRIAFMEFVPRRNDPLPGLFPEPENLFHQSYSHRFTFKINA
ncbi:MAG: hypothetical protein JNK08_00440 [Sediminibacterium sp.]|nr:hypothetical protein [Sediminibacterium sp.]